MQESSQYCGRFHNTGKINISAYEGENQMFFMIVPWKLLPKCDQLYCERLRICLIGREKGL